MELIKEDKLTFLLKLDGKIHSLDISGMPGCCPDTKAVLAGLKLISEDPQNFFFFQNCFGNPHGLTEFSQNLVNKHYDSEIQKQKIFRQARLLTGQIREYFLEAILKHGLWTNESDYWTNVKFTFERELIPDIRQMLVAYDIRRAKNQLPGSRQTSDLMEEADNDFVSSTIEDYLYEFQEEGILTSTNYEKLINYLKEYFEYGSFPEKLDKISVGRVNKKRFGWALNQLFRSLKDNNETLPFDYLQFAKQNLSIFKDVALSEQNITGSILYKYFTTKVP